MRLFRIGTSLDLPRGALRSGIFRCNGDSQGNPGACLLVGEGSHTGYGILPTGGALELLEPGRAFVCTGKTVSGAWSCRLVDDTSSQLRIYGVGVFLPGQGPGGSGLGDPMCDPAAIAWANALQITPHEKWGVWGWGCGSQTSNLAHWLYFVGAKGHPRNEEAQQIIWNGIWRLWRAGQITAADADRLWQGVAGFSSSIGREMCGPPAPGDQGPSAQRARGDATCPGILAGGSGAGSGGSGGGSFWTAGSSSGTAASSAVETVTGALRSVPVWGWVALAGGVLLLRSRQ